MRINLTFVIQVIHFIIAYKILERLVFIPALEALSRRQAEENELKSECESHEAKIANIDQHGAQILMQFQKRVQQEHAQLCDSIQVNKKFVEAEVAAPIELTAEMAQKIKNEIITKVLHE